MTVLYCLCLVNLIANSAYSSIAPFYPNEAVGKGVPTSMLGIVISAYSISMAIFSPLFANLLNTHGPKRVLIIGCLCEAVAMIVFGLFDFIQDPVAYATCSFCCRFLEGFGFGCLNSSCKSFVKYTNSVFFNSCFLLQHPKLSWWFSLRKSWRAWTAYCSLSRGLVCLWAQSWVLFYTTWVDSSFLFTLLAFCSSYLPRSITILSRKIWLDRFVKWP